MGNNILKVENLTRWYTIGEKDKQKIEVLKGLNFDVEEGEFIGIMGRSGCGKTTLLKTLGQIANPDEGKVWYKGKDITDFYGDALAEIRRKELGFVFQDFYLMESLSVLENILLPLILNEDDIKESKKKAYNIAEKFQISHLLHKKTYELSGGEKQRTAICRTLIADPSLIFADEPTGNLDSKSAKNVIEAMEQINTDFKKTIILVTHDALIASYCKRIIFLKDGEVQGDIRKEGSNYEFYQAIIRRMESI